MNGAAVWSPPKHALRGEGRHRQLERSRKTMCSVWRVEAGAGTWRLGRGTRSIARRRSRVLAPSAKLTDGAWCVCADTMTTVPEANTLATC